ncbi:hypothetical protein IPM62_03495 [Candidatus Woesebacteria bacterium]|nr:MAG: hypothetical protein IPM62_03495 [Candidatus Woesebacteria bacterium]
MQLQKYISHILTFLHKHPFLILVIGISTGLAIASISFNSVNHGLRGSKLEDVETNESYKFSQPLSRNELSQNKNGLTEEFHFANEVYMLYYDYVNIDSSNLPQSGKYVLVNNTTQEEIVLFEEPFDNCRIDSVVKSNLLFNVDTLHILSTSLCGDRTKRILMNLSNEVSINGQSSYKVGETKIIDLGDNFNKFYKVLGFLSSEKILVQEITLNASGLYDQIRYLTVNINNTHDMREIDN